MIVFVRSVQYKICLSPGDILYNCLYGDGPPEKLKYLFPASGILRNGPDKNDSNNGNEHVGMQKRC